MLESDIANYAVNKTQEELFNWQKGIRSFQIETAIKKYHWSGLKSQLC